MEAVVDVATLTGACIVALGDKIAGLFTPSDSMAAQLKNASQTGEEKVGRDTRSRCESSQLPKWFWETPPQ